MGGEYEKRRYPRRIYLTGIILTAILVSGCSVTDFLARPEKPETSRLTIQMEACENQINANEFEQAARTNQNIQNIIRAKAPESGYALILKQALMIEALLTRFLKEQEETVTLTNQVQKKDGELEQNRQAIESLKQLIHNLNQTTQALETQKNQLEKQIERMKQIDLK